ncbi:lonely Cys domain-containing protein [Streptomyces sp. M10(2022)]
MKDLAHKTARKALDNWHQGLALPAVAVTGYGDGPGSGGQPQTQAAGAARADELGDEFLDRLRHELALVQITLPPGSPSLTLADLDIIGSAGGRAEAHQGQATIELVWPSELLNDLRLAEHGQRGVPLDVNALAHRLLHLRSKKRVTPAVRSDLYSLVTEAHRAGWASSIASLGAYNAFQQGVLDANRDRHVTVGGNRVPGLAWGNEEVVELGTGTSTIHIIKERADGSFGTEPPRDAPWRSGPVPYVVEAMGSHNTVEVPWRDGRPRKLDIGEFVELVARDLEREGLPKDHPIVLAVPSAGARELDLPRLLAERTGRTVWSHSGNVIAGDVAPQTFGIAVILRLGEAQGAWIRSEPGLAPDLNADAPGWHREVVTQTIVSQFTGRQTGRSSHQPSESVSFEDGQRIFDTITKFVHWNIATGTFSEPLDLPRLGGPGTQVAIADAHGSPGSIHFWMEGAVFTVLRTTRGPGCSHTARAFKPSPRAAGTTSTSARLVPRTGRCDPGSSRMEPCPSFLTRSGRSPSGSTTRTSRGLKLVLPSDWWERPTTMVNGSGFWVRTPRGGVGRSWCSSRSPMLSSSTAGRWRRTAHGHGRGVDRDALQNTEAGAGVEAGVGERGGRRCPRGSGPGYAALLRGVAALDRMWQDAGFRDSGSRDAGPFTMDLFHRIVTARLPQGRTKARQADYLAVLHAADNMPAGTHLRGFVTLPPALDQAIGWMAGQDLEDDAVVLLQLSGPDQVGAAERSRMFWARVKMYETLATPGVDLDTLAAQVSDVALTQVNEDHRNAARLRIATLHAIGRDGEPGRCGGLRSGDRRRPEERHCGGVPTKPGKRSGRDFSGLTKVQVVDLSKIATPGGLGDAPWHGKDPNGYDLPTPYVVRASLDPKSLDRRLLVSIGTTTRSVSREEFIELLANDHRLLEKSQETPVVLAISELDLNSLPDLQIALAQRLGRTIYSTFFPWTRPGPAPAASGAHFARRTPYGREPDGRELAQDETRRSAVSGRRSAPGSAPDHQGRSRRIRVGDLTPEQRGARVVENWLRAGGTEEEAAEWAGAVAAAHDSGDADLISNVLTALAARLDVVGAGLPAGATTVAADGSVTASARAPQLRTGAARRPTTRRPQTVRSPPVRPRIRSRSSRRVFRRCRPMIGPGNCHCSRRPTANGWHPTPCWWTPCERHCQTPSSP